MRNLVADSLFRVFLSWTYCMNWVKLLAVQVEKKGMVMNYDNNKRNRTCFLASGHSILYRADTDAVDS